MEHLTKISKTIINISFWNRVFKWNVFKTKLEEVHRGIERIIINNENFSKQFEDQKKEIIEVQVNYKNVQKQKDDLEQKNEILNNRISDLKPLEADNIRISKELGEIKKREDWNKKEMDKSRDQYDKMAFQLQEREDVRIENELNKEREKEEEIQRTWQNHENNVSRLIKQYCHESSMTYIDDWEHDKDPDNIIKLNDKYIVLDAKSPRNLDLSNFQTYITTSAGELKKYAKHKNVWSTLYLVVPDNAWECLKNTNYDTPNYSVSVISTQTLETVICYLKQIELLSKVKEFSNEDFDNFIRSIALLMHVTKRDAQIDIWKTEQKIQAIKYVEGVLPVNIKDKVDKQQAGLILNPPTDKRKKNINIKEEDEKYRLMLAQNQIKSTVKPAKEIKIIENEKKLN